MLQTVWDSLQQVIRILLYLGGSALVTRGLIDDATSNQLVGAALIVINAGWTIYWNRRQVMTVDGMTAASKDPNIPVSGATVVEIKAAKR